VQAFKHICLIFVLRKQYLFLLFLVKNIRNNFKLFYRTVALWCFPTEVQTFKHICFRKKYVCLLVFSTNTPEINSLLRENITARNQIKGPIITYCSIKQDIWLTFRQDTNQIMKWNHKSAQLSVNPLHYRCQRQSYVFKLIYTQKNLFNIPKLSWLNLPYNGYMQFKFS
jgi:hypothetical protein